jgi:hypothetical protein
MAVLNSYVDDGTIIVQSNTWDKNLVKLKLAYKIVFELTQSMGLVLKHSKLEGFHFSQKHGDSNPTSILAMPPTLGLPPCAQAPHGDTWASSSIVLSHSGSTSSVTQTRLSPP